MSAEEKESTASKAKEKAENVITAFEDTLENEKGELVVVQQLMKAKTELLRSFIHDVGTVIDHISPEASNAFARLTKATRVLFGSSTMQNERTKPQQALRPQERRPSLTPSDRSQDSETSAGTPLPEEGVSSQQTCARRLVELLPIPAMAHWLPHYTWREDLQPDLVAGITLAFMGLPQGLAYARDPPSLVLGRPIPPY